MKKTDRKETEFTTFIRGLITQAINLTILLGSVENMHRMSDDSFEILLNASRRRLSPQPVKPTEASPKPGAKTEQTTAPPPPDDDEFWEEG